MDLFPTPEHTLLSETAADFVARTSPRERVRALEASDAGFEPSQWDAMADLGWTELAPLELALVAEQLGRGAVPSPLVTTAALRNALPSLALDSAPNVVMTLAALVPGAPNEWSGPHPAVDSTLTGVYLLVPYASSASRLVCATASGLVVIDSTVGDVRVRRHHALGGDAGFRVDLFDVPAQPLDGTLDVALTHLGVVSLAYAVGAAEGALDLSVQHARDREQFGRPIGSFQAVAHRCADMRAEIDACRVLTQRAAWALAGDAPDQDAAFAVATAMAYAKDALRRVAMHAHQVHGAIGFSSEYDLHLFTRRIKAFELTAGSTAHHQEGFAAAIGLSA